MKCKLYHLVIIDINNSFKDASIAMCKIIHHYFDIITKCICKGLIFERFHKYLNKAVTIYTGYRPKMTSFFPLVFLQNMRRIVYQLMIPIYCNAENKHIHQRVL